MKKTVGKTDSYIRYGLGVVFIVLAIVWQWWMIFPAIIALVTGYFGFCALYSLFGISTCKIKE